LKYIKHTILSGAVHKKLYLTDLAQKTANQSDLAKPEKIYLIQTQLVKSAYIQLNMHIFS